MQKICSKCQQPLPLSAFQVRSVSRDGYQSQCRECRNHTKRREYRANPAPVIARTTQNRRARLDKDPLYRRYLNAIQDVRRRGSVVPKWVTFNDFVPILTQAVALGPGFEIDHLLPLNGDKVCGLHVPENLRVITGEANRRKGRHFP